MLTLRLSRAGTKKRPVYHLVATDSRSRRDGRFVESLGYFIPNKDVMVLNFERIEYWTRVGAVVSETAKNLIKKAKKAPPPPKPQRRTTTTAKKGPAEPPKVEAQA